MQQFLEQIGSVPPAIWGILSALSFGIADFIARFTSRRFGHHASLCVTLAVGVLVFFPPFLIQSGVSSLPVDGLILVGVHGLFFAIAMLLLYQVLARGPINVVAPIVAAHPVFVVAVAFVLGSRLAIGQWSAMVALLVCVLVIVGCLRDDARNDSGDTRYLRRTVWLSLATSLAYAMSVVAAQQAVGIVGQINTLWLGHALALASLLIVGWRRLKYPNVSPKWWGALVAQGVLNVAGVGFLLAGSLGAFPEITALLSSGFSVVTILLAAMFLRERMSLLQTVAVVGVFVATGYLTISG